MSSPTTHPSLTQSACLNILFDGRISIHAGSSAEATRIAQRFQALGNNVRQYGSHLIIHADGQ